MYCGEEEWECRDECSCVMIPIFWIRGRGEGRGRVYVRRSTPVGTHTRRRLYVLCLRGVCEEINAGWVTLEKKVVCIVGGKRM